LVKRINNLSEEVRLETPFVSYGSLPDYDYCSYQIAISMVLMSTRPGKYDKSYTQFDSIRHLRSYYSNFDKATTATVPKSSVGRPGTDLESFDGPTSSIWFRRFFSGCKARMGQISKPNLALTTSLVLRLIEEVRNGISTAQDRASKFDLVIFGSYVVISYVISLRGSEGLMIDLAVINRELDRNLDYRIIGLKGRVKGEAVDRDHLFPCVSKTSSGLDVER